MKYAEKLQEAQQRAERYEKRLDPIIEWGQIQGFPAGTEITSEVLRRAKEHDELKAKVERYEKALKQIEQMSDPGDYWKAICDIKAIASNALTPKTGSDERRL